MRILPLSVTVRPVKLVGLAMLELQPGWSTRRSGNQGGMAAVTNH